jgi:hypothetical protein
VLDESRNFKSCRRLEMGDAARAYNDAVLKATVAVLDGD